LRGFSPDSGNGGQRFHTMRLSAGDIAGVILGDVEIAAQQARVCRILRCPQGSFCCIHALTSICKLKNGDIGSKESAAIIYNVSIKDIQRIYAENSSKI
jgi:hypothetical protein